APKPAPVKDLPIAPDIAASRQTSQSPVSISPIPPRLPEPPPPPKSPPVAASIPAVAPVAASVTKTSPPAGTSGRIIWTGELARDAVLTIDGRKASKGSLSGELPSGDVRVGAYPAELTSDGLKILTGNPRYSQPRVEQPSAANGWQKTQYVYDPK